MAAGTEKYLGYRIALVNLDKNQQVTSIYLCRRLQNGKAWGRPGRYRANARWQHP
ncbi:MAG: hypothetical protein IPF93_12850 [Saprospiraceae bacterium]|nr:hypothetical protein [Saprospiraceae bacterium]